MANTRLELRMKKDAVAYAQGSPLLLEAYALHRDTTSGDCIAQLKWKNIDRRGVQAVMVDLITYDAFNNQINTVQYQYNGLNAAQGAEFGGKTPIIIHDDRIVRFEVALKAVSFADDSVWNAANDGIFEPLPKAKNQSLPDELCDQLARDLAKQGCAQAALYDVQTAHDLWQCGCGSWQKEGDPCLKCHIARQNLAAASDAALLQAHLDEYRVEQEKQRIEAEKRAEAERIEREKREEAEKIARKKREAEAARKKAEAEARRRRELEGVYNPNRTGPIGDGSGRNTNQNVPIGSQDRGQAYGKPDYRTPGGGASSEIPDSYFNGLKRYFDARWQQPPRSLLGNNDPKVVVELTVSDTGKVLASRIISRSGINAMDESVKRLLDNLDLVPRPPSQVTFQLVLKVE